jgi:uncharacterized protein YjiK
MSTALKIEVGFTLKFKKKKLLKCDGFSRMNKSRTFWWIIKERIPLNILQVESSPSPPMLPKKKNGGQRRVTYSDQVEVNDLDRNHNSRTK